MRRRPEEIARSARRTSGYSCIRKNLRTRWLNAIKGARARVYLTTYLLTDLRVIDMLSQARANGAEARVLLEDAPFGGGVAAKSTFERLEKAGIPVKPGNPAFRFTHQKSLVIDQTAYVLTANMTRSAFQANREFGLITTDTRRRGRNRGGLQCGLGTQALCPGQSTPDLETRSTHAPASMPSSPPRRRAWTCMRRSSRITIRCDSWSRLPAAARGRRSDRPAPRRRRYSDADRRHGPAAGRRGAGPPIAIADPALKGNAVGP